MFPKEGDHLVTFQSMMDKTQIDFLLYNKSDRGLCIDCKVMLSQWHSTQDMLYVMELEIKGESKRRAVYGQPKIKWGALTKDKAQVLGDMLFDYWGLEE